MRSDVIRKYPVGMMPNMGKGVYILSSSRAQKENSLRLLRGRSSIRPKGIGNRYTIQDAHLCHVFRGYSVVLRIKH